MSTLSSDAKLKRNILERRDEIESRLEEAEGVVIAIQGELTALQHVCRHPNAKTWTAGDYGGGSTTYFECPDCGKETAT